MTVRVFASRHWWRVETSTGWSQDWWALTQSGMRRAVAGMLAACGFPYSTHLASEVIELARGTEWVELRTEDLEMVA